MYTKNCSQQWYGIKRWPGKIAKKPFSAHLLYALYICGSMPTTYNLFIGQQNVIIKEFLNWSDVFPSLVRAFESEKMIFLLFCSSTVTKPPIANVHTHKHRTSQMLLWCAIHVANFFYSSKSASERFSGCSACKLNTEQEKWQENTRQK